MSIASQIQASAPTRSAVIAKWVTVERTETGLGEPKFAERVAEAYLAQVPEEWRRHPLRTPPAHGEADDFYRVQAANHKLVLRYLDGTTPMPIDVEEAFIAALSPRYRERCVFELCTRIGVLPVHVGVDTDVEALAQWMRDEAAAIEAMAPILADGVIDESDRPYAQRAVDALQRVMSGCAGTIRRLQAIGGSQVSIRVVGGE